MGQDDTREFATISTHGGPDWNPWAYCQDEADCGHQTRIDIAAIIACVGDMPSDRFRACLRCSKCGGRDITDGELQYRRRRLLGNAHTADEYTFVVTRRAIGLARSWCSRWAAGVDFESRRR
jgi:hypothetical protein